MTATAEAYGFGARAPWAQKREPEYDMKERVRLSGLFPRVRNQPMSVQLQALLKDFEKNAALAGILERRRRLEEQMQYEMRSRETMAAVDANLAPAFRTGTASFATSAAVASRIAAAPDAADVMTGAAPKAKAGAITTGPGVSQVGGSSGSAGPVMPKAVVPKPKAAVPKPKAGVPEETTPDPPRRRRQP